ncbi:hypothetical protein G6O69_27090 [Pseudenhygromyxa sp. WMMC2535]|uniref:hypothetical protein n=1 Tax=Pseudenhygromyxa sp. WMMC2535 TaxID=2712867 RepID=UPI001551CC07|nr:hypothetical protein [Pseudenhygromyxa sp. WMMC2535]NVB41534.1 hypothetical protein [Pseudenhygromyxa sp. WMMC2535]
MSRRRERSIEAILDRIEDRLIDAPIGLHEVGEPASEQAVAEQAQLPALPDEALVLWRRWDGFDLASGEARIFSLIEQVAATREASEAGMLAAEDRVIGELGLALLVVPADPWQEGGEVVLVEDDGQRAPYASSVIKLALGLVAEMSLLYDDEGEYREGLFEEHGELSHRAERKLLRRRLDFDEDAPLPRFRLGQLLRRAGELRGARAELRRVLRCAPEFEWAHWELGRVALELGEGEEAASSFAAAAERCDDPHLRALFLAWQLLACAPEDSASREALAEQILALDPGFVGAREAGLREAVEDEDTARARELLALGLAVAPRHLGLLSLRAAVDALPEPEPLEPEEASEDEAAEPPPAQTKQSQAKQSQAKQSQAKPQRARGSGSRGKGQGGQRKKSGRAQGKKKSPRRR